MRAWIQASYGLSDPKQFCPLHGSRSMFQLTLDWARQIVVGGEIVVVTIGDFERISKIQIDRRRVELLVQSVNRGTTCAIYMALSHVTAHDPNARVVIFPSDRYVEPEATFVDSIRRAIALSSLIPDRLLLIGVTPDKMETDYGWLVPGTTLARYGENQLSSVAAFLKKPSVKEIRGIQEAGGLWNTFVIIGTVRTFFEVGGTRIPRTLIEYYRSQSTIEGSEENATRAFLSDAMALSDFSKDVLQHVPDRLAVFHSTGLYWSDWGRPEQVTKSGIGPDSHNEQNQPRL